MRTARIELQYDSQDISAGIAPFVEGFSYTDVASGKADDLQISLNDQDQRWKNGWHPTKGATLTAAILCKVDGKESRLDCGVFEIDEIESSGPPEKVVLKAASVAISRSLRRETRSKAWENITLQAIAAAITEGHGLSLFYQADSLDFGRVDQREESDLTFLKRLCDENGLNLKVSGEKIIIFSGKEFEQKDASFTFVRGDKRILLYSFRDKADDVYRSCQISYQDPETKELVTHIFTPDNAPATGQILKVSARVESLAAAQRLAVTRLRQKNKKEITGSLTLLGDTGLLAGLNIQVQGFGVYDGKYFITEAGHTQTAGYRSTIKINKVLDY
jgi:phage protein D